MRKRLREVFRPEARYGAFFLSVMAFCLGYGLYKGVADNYLAEIVGMNEMDRGVAEFFRELPGLLLVFILAAFYTFSAERIYQLGALILLCGIGMLTAAPSTRVWVIVAMCVHSLGDHIQLGMKNALTLEYARPGKGGLALGLLGSVSQLGTLAGYAVIAVAFLFVSGQEAFRAFFLASTVIVGVGVYLSARLPAGSRPETAASRFYFRRKYTKYYLLEVFYGARKQVFFTFGPYVLILHYGASTSVISLLLALSAVCCFFAAPVVGRIIDRLGYKVVMVTDTLILVVVCFFYGFADHLFPTHIAFLVCCVNYLLDSVISLASMASNVYVQDLADSAEEVRATLSTGISVNHLITILIALFGGWVWKTLGIETLFTLSAVLGLCNSAYAASIARPKK